MKKGFLPASPALALGLLLATLALFILGPILLMYISPTIKIILQFIIAVTIFNWVRNTIGPGIASWVISGILIYIFVIRLPGLAVGLWATYYLVGLGIASMFIWGFTLFSGR